MTRHRASCCNDKQAGFLEDEESSTLSLMNHDLFIFRLPEAPPLPSIGALAATSAGSQFADVHCTMPLPPPLSNESVFELFSLDTDSSLLALD